MPKNYRDVRIERDNALTKITELENELKKVKKVETRWDGCFYCGNCKNIISQNQPKGYLLTDIECAKCGVQGLLDVVANKPFGF